MQFRVEMGRSRGRYLTREKIIEEFARQEPTGEELLQQYMKQDRWLKSSEAKGPTTTATTSPAVVESIPPLAVLEQHITSAISAAFPQQDKRTEYSVLHPMLLVLNRLLLYSAPEKERLIFVTAYPHMEEQQTDDHTSCTRSLECLRSGGPSRPCLLLRPLCTSQAATGGWGSPIWPRRPSGDSTR